MTSRHTNGEIYERVAKLETRVEGLEEMQHEIRDDVKAVRTSIDKATGGWKLAILLGIPTAIGAGLMYIVNLVLPKP